jgi:hypothetical protein
LSENESYGSILRAREELNVSMERDLKVFMSREIELRNEIEDGLKLRMKIEAINKQQLFKITKLVRDVISPHLKPKGRRRKLSARS